MAQETENTWSMVKKQINKDALVLNDAKAFIIRVLPKKIRAETNIIKYIEHWISQTSGGKTPIRHMPENRCKLCGYVAHLWATVEELRTQGLSDESPEIIKLLKDISEVRAAIKFDMNVIDRNDAKEKDGTLKIKCYNAPKSVAEPLADLAEDPNWGSCSHDEDGYDIKIVPSKQGGFIKFNVSVASKSSTPLSAAEIKALNEKGTDLLANRLKTVSSESQINTILKGANKRTIQQLADNDLSVLGIIDEDDVINNTDGIEIEINGKTTTVQANQDKSSKRKASGTRTKTKPEPEPEPEPELEPEEEDCFGKYSDANENCETCDQLVDCVKQTRNKAKEAAKQATSSQTTPKGRRNVVVEHAADEDQPVGKIDAEPEDEYEDDGEDKSQGFQCFGLYDVNEEACNGCEAEVDCVPFSQFVKKAQGMEINVSDKQDNILPTKEIKRLMAEKSSKKGKNIAF